MGEISVKTEDLIKFVATVTGAKRKDLAAMVEELEEVTATTLFEAITPVITKHSDEYTGLLSRKGYQKAERKLKEALPFVDFQSNKLDDMVEELKDYAISSKEKPKTEEFTVSAAIKMKGVKEHYENIYKDLESNVEQRIRTEQELDNFLMSKFKEVGVQFPKTEEARQRAERRQLKELKEQYKFKKGDDGFIPIDEEGNPLYDTTSKSFMDMGALIQKSSLYDIGIADEPTTPPSNIPIPPANKAALGNNFGFTNEQVKSLQFSDLMDAKNSGDHEKAAFIENAILEQ